MRRVQIIGALCLASVACLIGAVSANAAPTDPFQYQYSFGGPQLAEADRNFFGGYFSPPPQESEIENPSSIAVNHVTGNVLVFQHGEIDQFDAEGHRANFAALGSPTLPVGAGRQIFVDNTGGASQGNIYVVDPSGCCGQGAEEFWSFAEDGSPIGTNPHSTWGTMEVLIRALGVRPDGNLTLLGFDGPTGEYFSSALDPAGLPVGPRKPFAPNGSFTPYAFDELGDYYAPGGPSFRKYDASDDFADLGETGLPVGDQVSSDPSTNDLYVRQGNQILGIHYSDPLVESTPFQALSGITSTNDAFAFDGSGETLYVAEGTRVSVYHREPNAAPRALLLGVDGIGSSRALLHGRFQAAGSATSYHFEYGVTDSYGSSTPETSVPLTNFPSLVAGALNGLAPNTTYHVRLVATNAVDSTYGADMVFKTYPLPPPGGDTCPNVLARKQTIAQRLPDCRAYELASAADTGGYDVESYLAPGQNPFPGFPLATDKLLYATHSGAVPGPWNATNKGPDPYVATRTANGWVTQYQGLPSNLNPAAGTFSSVLGEADSSLSTLAFAGPNICSPCFTDGGLQTGIPVRLPSGQLVQGMSGSLAGNVPATAKPEGRVAKYFSGDGKKLIFASKYAFEPGANNSNGSLTVYARNLAAGTTEIVSTDASGNALTGEGISELDVSANGSRVVIGKKLGVDLLGNELVHPYLHIAGRAESIDLAPLAGKGVLYAGMTSDGSKVFFTSADKLVGSDTDTSADLYEADVDASGNLALEAITTNNSDACAPLDCSAVPISGGGGVASSTGAIYFLSPESFGGQGTPNLPNLYQAQPSGQISLVATLEPDNPLVLDSIKANATRRTGDFQTTPSGNFAAFTSALPLTGVNYFGLRNVFRYEASSGQLICPSCDDSGTTNTSLAENVELAPNGLSLLEDGRVFFTTRFPLVLNDPNGKKDVYEWVAGGVQLISAGTGSFDSALLSASADGTDDFFFTHAALASREDSNGALMRIYDAREGGGFFKLPPAVPCQASDECHGPGTPTPAPADIKSSGKTSQGNVIVCAKNRVKKRGKCVKKKAHANEKHKKKRKGGAKKRTASTDGKRGGRNA